LPDSYRRIRDGDDISIGGHPWQVVTGSGHSPEHACLLCPALGVMISGDQILPRISSNVSVFAMQPDANPLRDWLDSCTRLKQVLPPDLLVLPAHKEPFRGLQTRLTELREGQEQALGRLLPQLAAPQRTIDVLDALFGRRIGESDVQLLTMATG